MKTAMAWRGSITMGLLVTGGLCTACGSSSSGSGDDGNSMSSGGSGATASGSAGSSGSASASAGSTASAAGTSAVGAGGTTTVGNGGAASGGGGAATSAGGLGASGAGATGGGGSAGSSSTTPTGKTDYAPYYEIGSTTGAFKSLVDLQTKAGLNEVTLAFVLSGGGCSTDSTVSGDLKDINAFVAAGGHVKASFGGADGTYVEAGCADAASLATAIGNFVDATKITDLDFDVEQSPVMTSAMNTMRGQALKMVQDSKNIQVSFTLGTDENGLSSEALSCVTKAVAAGVTISHVNLMVMDYGNQPQGTAIAPIAIGSLNGGLTQIKKLIPSLTDDQAWAMLGATPDIGQNDDNEIFSLADAQSLSTFAIQHKLGLISFWNIQRDQVCGKGECSQQDNANFDYDKIFQTVTQ